MQTKNAKAISKAESDHIARVKELPCSVCDHPGPSDAHHINQGQHYTVVAVCKDCHQGSFNGWHGQARIWKVKKLDELGALAVTIQRLVSVSASRVRAHLANPTPTPPTPKGTS
jgi:hypothetical protein